MFKFISGIGKLVLKIYSRKKNTKPIVKSSGTVKPKLKTVKIVDNKAINKYKINSFTFRCFLLYIQKQCLNKFFIFRNKRI